MYLRRLFVSYLVSSNAAPFSNLSPDPFEPGPILSSFFKELMCIREGCFVSCVFQCSPGSNVRDIYLMEKQREEGNEVSIIASLLRGGENGCVCEGELPSPHLTYSD